MLFQSWRYEIKLNFCVCCTYVIHSQAAGVFSSMKHLDEQPLQGSGLLNFPQFSRIFHESAALKKSSFGKPDKH